MIEKQRLILETVVILAGFFLALVSTFGPASAIPPEQWAQQQEDRTRLAVLEAALRKLEARNNEVQKELAMIEPLLERTASDSIWLQQGYDALSTQVTTTTARLSDVDRILKQTEAQTAEVGEFLSLHKIITQRDEAKEEAERNAEQIRDLTLKLHRAGVYP
jgi:predicted  nucleic acid-binding Zn-ribbon protein